jgi:excisionase family DNA binding protein
MSRLLKIPEVAERLRLCERTVRMRISTGEIPAFRLGPERHAPIRVDEEALRAWLTSSQVKR